MNLFHIPADAPFLDTIASHWLSRCEGPLDLARGLILLPTRRAARALAEAFLRVSGGRPMLLPRITALGAMDEAPLALAGALDVPAAVDTMQRLAALTRLILAMHGKDGAPRTADRAWGLAAELAALMDEAERAEIDLAARLPEAADPAYAAHWRQTLQFLHIVTEAWPRWLAENGLMNPAARQVALLEAQSEAWRASAPDEPVLVAGVTYGTPAVTRLLRVVAELPSGAVVLPALDIELDDESWANLDNSHPQSGLRHLLASLGATRDDVSPFPGLRPIPSLTSGLGGIASRHPTTPDVTTGLLPTCAESGGSQENRQAPAMGRAGLLARALLPASALYVWQEPAQIDTTGLSRLHPADQQEEAAAIAAVLRNTIQSPGRQAALVTPDRALAARVSAELLRFGVVADDSAGEPLAETPPAVFLRLLTRAVAEQFAPVPLLSLLKHPLAAAGLAPSACRAAARALEKACLRGPRPPPGLSELRRALDKRRPSPQATDLLRRFERCLEPSLRIAASVQVAPAEALAALIASAERLAGTDETAGPARLWAGEDGDALATTLAAVQDAFPMLPDQPRLILPGLLDAVLEGAVVRTRRALRGRTDQREHPRVFIWGLLEARLQSPEVVVLGGLAEGVWPPVTDPGPWLSRQMRQAVGLPSPDQAIGQAAHDFVAASCAAKQVVLSCPARRDGAPAVPACWLTRLDMMLAGQTAALPVHPAVEWVRALDQPADGPHPVSPPRPCPPTAMRPRRLSVTEIETWLRDPYAIYARRILKLEALRPLEEETDAADYGLLVHEGLRLFLDKHGNVWPPNAAAELSEAMAKALATAHLRAALAAWWSPRLERIARWVAETEELRRAKHPPVMIASEVSGRWVLPRAGGDFNLVGRADRIERRADGTLAIIDYKTGTPPTQKQVEAGLAPQLLLEAAMAERGGFGPDLIGPSAELSYWHLTGGFEPGKLKCLFRGIQAEIAAAVEEARNSLGELIDLYDQPDRCYLSRPHPARAPRYSDYTQLARVSEWVAAEDHDE